MAKALSESLHTNNKSSSNNPNNSSSSERSLTPEGGSERDIEGGLIPLVSSSDGQVTLLSRPIASPSNKPNNPNETEDSTGGVGSDNNNPNSAYGLPTIMEE